MLKRCLTVSGISELPPTLGGTLDRNLTNIPDSNEFRARMYHVRDLTRVRGQHVGRRIMRGFRRTRGLGRGLDQSCVVNVRCGAIWNFQRCTHALLFGEVECPPFR